MTANDYPAYIDRYDAEVVDQLEEGTVYSAKKIRRGYKRFTRINKDETARQRQKELFSSPAFEMEKYGYFRYLGPVEPEGI